MGTAPRRLLRSRPAAALLLLVGAAVALQLGLLVFVVVHNLSTDAAYDSDFAQLYTGATTWRGAGPTHAYDLAAQQAAFSHITAGHGRGWSWVLGWAPSSLLLGLPLSFLSLPAAYNVWEFLQLGLLAAAALIAASTAAPQLSWRLRAAAAGGAALGAGTIATVLFGQWDGLPALGVAGAYALWRRGHDGRAALVLTVLLLSGKPHLALGLLAFVLGRRSRRGVVGLLAGGCLIGMVDLTLVHISGLRGYADTLRLISGLPAAASLSLLGLLAGTFGDTPLVGGFSALGALALVACGAAFGWRSRTAGRLEVSLLGAVCVSLLASPHLFSQDLALLIPVCAALLACAIGRGFVEMAYAGVLGIAGVSIAAEYQVLPLGSLHRDPIVPVLLLAAAAGAWSALRAPGQVPQWSGQPPTVWAEGS